MFKKVQHLILSGAICTLVGVAVFMTGCADRGMTDGMPNMDTNAEFSLNVIKDRSVLSQYVTNYTSKASTKAPEAGGKTYSIPECPDSIPEDAVEYSDINFYYMGEWSAVPTLDMARTAKVTKPTELALVNIGQTIYVQSDFTVVGINGATTVDANGRNAADYLGTVTIYVLPGGSLTFKGNWNNGLSVADCGHVNIVNYGSLKAANPNDQCLLHGGISVFSGAKIDIPNLYLSGITLVTEAPIEAKNFYLTNNSQVYATCRVDVEEEFVVENAANITTGYVKAGSASFRGNGEKQSIRLLDQGCLVTPSLYIRNVFETSLFAEAGDCALIDAQSITVNDIDVTTTFDNIYIKTENWTGDNRACNEAMIFAASEEGKVNNLNGVELIVNSPLSCAPLAVIFPETGDEPEDGPEIEVIGKVENPEHDHPISATCIEVVGNQAYMSWHKRGGSIHGCMEWIEVNDDQVKLNAWMETPSWRHPKETDPNVTGDDAEGAFDFNHVIFDAQTYSLLTVGDHAKKGGFIGRIYLNQVVDGENVKIMDARALISAASGNSVVIRPSDRALLITSAKGCQIMPFGDGNGFVVNNKKGDFVHEDDCTAATSVGSVKHIAINGNNLVTIEYTEQPTEILGWDDNTTALPAEIKKWNTESWLNGEPEFTIPVDAFSPIYGKNVIAVSASGEIYSCQGHNGVAKYDASGNEVARFNVAEYAVAQEGKFTENEIKKFSGAAANGLCVDGEYLYLANGAAGVWVLDKDTLAPVARYTLAGKASANYVKVANGYIYVAYGLDGIKVMKLI